MKTTEERIKEIIAKELGVPVADIKGESRLVGDLGADSLDIVSIILEVENNLGIEIESEPCRHAKTVDDVFEMARAGKPA